jgi:2',3'-cyclic-nucleotide 2'-phosphodiesterase (5'-nucleotidase family)
MPKFISLSFFSLLLFFATSCNTSYKAQSLAYHDYRITATLAQDSSLWKVLKPYRDSINKSMNEEVGWVEESLEKSNTHNTLGLFMADAFYTMAAEKFQTKIDIAFMNYGGIRLTQLPAGKITRAKIFELMPFDNVLILQKMKGNILQQFLDFVAEKGGWPVAGFTMEIKDKKAVNVLIDGKPLDPDKVYTVANSDFVANGGDGAEMLRPIPQENLGYLMREALFDYINKLKAQGKNVVPTKANPVTHVK